MEKLNKMISMRHLEVQGKRIIGLKFYPDKVVQALVKTLPDPKWHNKTQMVYLPNTSKNYHKVLSTFKGVAWLDMRYLSKKGWMGCDDPSLIISGFRKRTLPSDYRRVPDEFLNELENRKYAVSTVRSYVKAFESFINYYKEIPLHHLGDTKIKAFTQTLVSKK